MDKINKIKENFYLLKKHMRKDDYESLIKYSNISFLNILQIKKSQNNDDNKTINQHLEKQKEKLFSISSLSSNQQNKNSNEKITNIVSNKNFNENLNEKNDLTNNQINKKEENCQKKQINNLDNNNSNLLILNNEKVNNELEEIKKNKDSISESEDDSSSSDSIFISNKKNEEKDKMEIEEKKPSNMDCYFKNIEDNLFDNKYMLDCENDLLINSNCHYSPINNLNDNINIENTNNNNFNKISINNKNQIKIDKSNNETNQKIKTIQNKEQNLLIQNDKKLNQEDKKHIKKSKNNEMLKNINNQKVKTIYSPFNDMDMEIEMNMKKNIKENKTTNLTINNNSNINDNNNNNKIIVNQTNIILTNTNLTKFQIPLLGLDEFDTSSNKKNNMSKSEKVKDILNINNNMNINTNNINNEIQTNNQNIKLNNNNNLNQKKDFHKKENKTVNQIPINNKIIIDDDDDQKKIHKEKKKIDDNKLKEKSNDNPYVSLNGTQVKLKLDDNQILLLEERKRSLEKHNIKKESLVEKNYIKPLIKNKINPQKNNLNIVENKIIKQKTITNNNNNNNKELNNDNKKNLNLNSEKENNKEKIKEKEKEKGIFTKKESSAYLLSQLYSIIKNMKEKFKLDYQEDYKNMKISKVIDEILNNISSIEKLEMNKRRKNSMKQVPKLISNLFKSLEEVKRNDMILKNVISILDSVKLFFHQMKMNYLGKDGKVPINFIRLKTVIKYIYTLFKIKEYNSKCLKDCMKNEDNKKLLNFVQVYKSYQNSTAKLFHILKKISEDKQLKKYDNLNLYLEMDPLKIKHYGECYKQGRKMIDFIFEYFERSNSNEKKK